MKGEEFNQKEQQVQRQETGQSLQCLKKLGEGLGKREIRGGSQEKSPAALQEAAALGRTRASSGRTSAARSAHVRATDGELATGTKLITQGTSCVQRQVTTCCKRSTHQKRPHSFYNFKNQQPIHVGISAFTA